MSYERLIREHDAIDVLAGRLAAAAKLNQSTDQIMVLLWDLSLAVSEHLRHEDRTVYQPLLDEPADTKKMASSQDFERMFQDLRSDWEQYLGDWNSETVAADRATFKHETETMVIRLRERVRAETSLIYPVALQHGAIRLRDHRPVA